MMKLWIYENHICELRSEELYEWRSSQLNTQLLQLRKESLKKKSGLYGIRTLDLCDTGAPMIFIHIILHSAVQIYDFHIFIISSSSFHGFITNQFNDLLPVGLLAQLVERCNGISEVKGSNSVQAWIFSGFLFAIAKFASITVMIFFHINS